MELLAISIILILAIWWIYFLSKKATEEYKKATEEYKKKIEIIAIEYGVGEYSPTGKFKWKSNPKEGE